MMPPRPGGPLLLGNRRSNTPNQRQGVCGPIDRGSLAALGCTLAASALHTLPTLLGRPPAARGYQSAEAAGPTCPLPSVGKQRGIRTKGRRPAVSVCGM
jgi:hypothetical protein